VDVDKNMGWSYTRDYRVSHSRLLPKSVGTLTEVPNTGPKGKITTTKGDYPMITKRIL